MIAGVSWLWWIGFHLVVAVLLVVDALLTGHGHNAGKRRSALAWTGVLALLAMVFALWVGLQWGRQTALEWVAGYAIETSLSVDNLFVFLVLFQGFQIGPRRQHTALSWGVAGAMALRAGFIATGVTLLDRFGWVTWIFGLLLAWAAWRLVRGGDAKAAIPGWVMRMHPAHGSLLPVIVAVEVTDLLFAVDSIPAVLAITRNPFVAYTSNVAAVLGLRALYFALAALLDRIRYLHYGLGVLLGFVALKMLLQPWVEIPIVLSLVVMGAIMGICALASFWKRPE
jgi:tellurite resistance protein TerC